jgi:microcystin-dependent protein
MTTPFLGEIQIFGFQFAPSQWALANGTALSVVQNTALFSLLGTTYGGNGTTNFLLPNLVGRGPCNQGKGPSLTDRVIGETFGEFNAALDVTSMPLHAHRVIANNPPPGVTAVPTPTAGAALARFAGTNNALVAGNPAPNTTLSPNVVSVAGGNIPHPNQQPYLALNFCMALSGAFPSFPSSG